MLGVVVVIRGYTQNPFSANFECNRAILCQLSPLKAIGDTQQRTDPIQQRGIFALYPFQISNLCNLERTTAVSLNYVGCSVEKNRTLLSAPGAGISIQIKVPKRCP